MTIAATKPVAVPPGELLADMMKNARVTQKQLAEAVGVKPPYISQLVHGEFGISAEMAVKLGMALGTTPQFWLNAQMNWDLSQVNRRRLRVKRIVGTKAA